MTGPARTAAVGLVALAVAGGIVAGLSLHRGKPAAPAAGPARHRESPLGPVHGLMLMPLADPDGRVPTADLKK